MLSLSRLERAPALPLPLGILSSEFGLATFKGCLVIASSVYFLQSLVSKLCFKTYLSNIWYYFIQAAHLQRMTFEFSSGNEIACAFTRRDRVYIYRLYVGMVLCIRSKIRI